MKKYLILLASSLLTLTASLTSCSEFFDVDSDHILYADKNHLKNSNDSIYSLTGILNKLQALGDRTILLGEARGDLMVVTDATAADLRNVAMFNIDEDNEYNCPRDYYAVINNCNYYIAKADTSLKNNRNEYLFKGEYAAVKAIRAWTYLQLVTTYGKVPFVTEPILTKEQAERNYPMHGIKEVCDYFINEDGLQDLVEVDYPYFSDIKGLPSRLFYIPMNVILGDLNLWAGNYLDAAKCYYNYITKRNGENSTYATGSGVRRWVGVTWDGTVISSNFFPEVATSNAEVITIIPGDSIPSEGYYSQLRNIFNSTSDNFYKVSLVPSQSLIELSESQEYCQYYGNQVYYAPHGIGDHRDGDLRLINYWQTEENVVNSRGDNVTAQSIYKYASRNIRIYRRQLIYMRMAEALNCAGYPRFAYQVLASGINSKIMNDSILPEYPNDEAILSQFDFPQTRYILVDPRSGVPDQNTQGIHSRGCGFTLLNERYQMPYDTKIEAGPDSVALQIAYQQKEVEKMLIDEEALEFAFEGYRFYDLMRFALRNNDPSILADRVAKRSGAEDGSLKSLLMDEKNWYLNWNGKIGF